MRRTRLSVFFAVAAALAVTPGCSSDKDDATDTGAEGSGGNVNLDEDDIEFDGDGPVAITGRGWCEAGSDSSGFLFFFEVDYADPQGDYDVAVGNLTGNYVASDTPVFSDDILVCFDGECIASFRDGLYPPITCSTASDYYFVATVTDRTGITSEPIQIDWED